MDTSAIEELEAQVAHLKRHITEQDNEIYRLSRRVDQLNLVLDRMKLQVDSALRRSGGEMPADEKPPHY